MKRIVWVAVLAQVFAGFALFAAVLDKGTDAILAFGILAVTSAILALREEK